MWPLTFDRPPAPFMRADFDEAAPTVTVFGNLVDASQGKAEREAVLGNGDNRQSWQTFPLPKSPLTYFLSAGAIPPHTPELEVWVNGRLWTRVDAFFGHGPDEQIYIVREDADGPQLRPVRRRRDRRPAALRAEERHRHLPQRRRRRTGRSNPDATPTASERPAGFDKVTLAGIVSGGAEPEDVEKAREAAPGKVQSLGRLVSLPRLRDRDAVDSRRRHGGRRVGPVRRRAGGDPARAARGRPRGRVQRRARDHRACAALPRARPLPAGRGAGAPALRLRRRQLCARPELPAGGRRDRRCARRSASSATRPRAHGPLRPARAPPRRRRIREPHRGTAAERARRAVVQGVRRSVCSRPAPIRTTLMLPPSPRPLTGTLPCSPRELLQLVPRTSR